MTRTRLEEAEQHRVQHERVVALIEVLRALIAGHKSRAEVLAWARALPGGAQSYFRWGEADIVHTSLCSLDQRRGDAPLVREVDLRAYLRWLSEGDCFLADEEQLFTLEHDLDDFAAQTGSEGIRWWFEGIGWWVTIRFCTPARGWPFVALAALDRPGWMDFRKRRSDDWNDAIVELFEALAIDDTDVQLIHPQVELARLPVWVLWRQDDNGNRFEMARFRSYAKACAQERMFTARGHRQSYWVEPAG